MLDAICKELRNYFVKSVNKGLFEIANGTISPSDFLKEGQFFCIHGSVFNDGVHQFPNDALYDEAFEGEVWAMGVPPSLIALAEKIKVYEEDAASAPSPYVSESWQGYSYTKAMNPDGSPISWEKAFAKDLSKWRKI